MKSPSGISRRTFAKTTLAAATTAFIAAPAFVRGQNLNSKLNIAIIGAGGRGRASIAGCAGENIVALCNVNEVNLDAAAKQYPNARKIDDFRKLFDHAKEFDAVFVATRGTFCAPLSMG